MVKKYIGGIIMSTKSKKITTKEKEAIRKRNRAILDGIMTTDDVVNAIIKYTPEDATPVRKKEINRFFVNVYLDNIRNADKKREEENKETIEKVLQRATDCVSAYGTSVDSELEHKINQLACFSDQLRYYKIAKETQKWVNYAIWVSTYKDTIALTSVDQETKELVNGVCKLLHADLQYKDTGVADLELFDPFISGWNNQRFLLNTSKIQKLGSLNFQGKINLKNNGTNTVRPAGYSPIKFNYATPNSGNILVDPELAVDTYTKNILESYFAPYIGERDHWFEKTNEPNLVNVLVNNPVNGITERYQAVVGYYGKDTVALIATNILGMKVIVHPAYTEAWDKLLSNCFYQLSEIETNQALAYISQFFWLYDLVDLSTIPEDEFRNGLDMKLNNIFTSLKNHNGVNLLGRKFSFESYTNIFKFTLVGDNGAVIYVENNEAAYRLNNDFITVYC